MKFVVNIFLEKMREIVLTIQEAKIVKERIRRNWL